MLACVECKREMKVLKNGVGLDFGHGHVYPSDIWICPECGKQTANAIVASINDPEYRRQKKYIEMVQL